jgi:tRNA-2-methylthio-N6-dimethylallyladenosine synthase
MSYPDQCSKDVVQDRFDRLVALQEAISLDSNRAMVGDTVEVLVEGRGRKGNLAARTRTNKLVHVPGDLPPGTFADALIGEAHPHFLTGTLVPAAA